MRVGARVICVDDRASNRAVKVTGRPLVEGMTYTIRGISRNVIESVTSDRPIGLGVKVEENTVYHMEFDSEIYWCASRFRLVETPPPIEQVTHTAEPALV